jgi:hypothetical protein
MRCLVQSRNRQNGYNDVPIFLAHRLTTLNILGPILGENIYDIYAGYQYFTNHL